MKEENILGYEKIGKLMLKFSIPCIISLLVNSLYNIVDQIFIGRGIGYLGNGATNVVFPLTVISLAISLMLGDGTSSYLSLKLGEKKEEDASRGVANGVLLSVILSVLLTVLFLCFLPQLLRTFGCTKVLEDYALSYGSIIVFGMPALMIGTTLNSIIRSDGSPKYAMSSMIIGAVLNIILDPIFIFVFHMGVEGAAIATVISQIVTFVINIRYLKKFRSITLQRESFHLDKTIAGKVSVLGISSFITQMSIVFVMAVANNLLSKYGALSKYGSEIPITVLGIVMKINQILNSIIIGIAVGAQPILGYNYGAMKYSRVKKTLKIVLCCSVIVSSIAFLLFQTIPEKLILLFGDGNDLYMEFASLSFRTYLMLCICNGVQIPSGIFFQAIGKSVKSAILSLSRQVLFSIPAMIILSGMFGLIGVLYAGPVADFLAFILVILFLVKEMKTLTKEKQTSQKSFVEKESLKTKTPHFVITIAREYGSGGRYVGRLVAERLGIKLYDKTLIAKIAEKTGFGEEYILENEQKKGMLSILNDGYYRGLDNSDTLFVKESEVIKEIAEEGPCVIVGRCADSILEDKKNVFRVFIYSDMENKMKRVTKYYGLSKEKAKKEITKINKLRANHYKFYTEKEWSDPKNYDICIHSDMLGVEKTAELICNLATLKIGK